jgi:hypothetical protein
MTPNEAQRSREFFYEIFSTRQKCHLGCDKISSRTDKLIFKGMVLTPRVLDPFVLLVL